MPDMAYMTTARLSRHSFLTIVAFTLLALGMLRAALVVFHEPALGYGDQTIMHRTADCLGIHPIAEVQRRGELSRPHALYHTSGFNWHGCYPSSAVVIAVPVVLAYGVASIASSEPEILIPLKAFGFFNLLLVAFLSLVVAAALRPYPVASVVHAAVFFLLIADPVSTLWFNSLHTEPAALLGAYGAVAMSAVIVLSGGAQLRYWWLLGISLALLGFAREQFAFLPLALAALAAPALLQRSRRRTLAILGVAAGVAVLQVMLGPLRPADVDPINRVNTYLGAIVASSPDAERTLERLGLPARCAAMSGASWNARRGEAVCPEALELSSLAFLRLVPTEPLTLLASVSRVLPATEALVPGYLGISAEGPVQAVSDLPPRAMSFVALLARIPAIFHATIVMGLLISFPILVAWLVWTVRKEPQDAALPLTFTLLVAIAGYSLATTAFGGGIVWAERHHWLGSLATFGAIILLPLVVWQLSADLVRARIALAASFGVLLLASGWLLWTQTKPLAIGAMDTMAEGRVHALEVSGWALDPWGVRRVYATVGGGPQAEGTRGIERRDLDAIFPGYPEAIQGGFQITIPSNAWRENEQLRIYVENRAGGVTEIDRRVIRLRP